MVLAFLKHRARGFPGRRKWEWRLVVVSGKHVQAQAAWLPEKALVNQTNFLYNDDFIVSALLWHNAAHTAVWGEDTRSFWMLLGPTSCTLDIVSRPSLSLRDVPLNWVMYRQHRKENMVRSKHKFFTQWTCQIGENNEDVLPTVRALQDLFNLNFTPTNICCDQNTPYLLK